LQVVRVRFLIVDEITIVLQGTRVQSNDAQLPMPLVPWEGSSGHAM